MCILLMLPQLDLDVGQRLVSLQPAGDELKTGPAVMSAGSVTLSDGHGRETVRRPVLRGLGEFGACPPGHADGLIWAASAGPRAGLVLSAVSSGKSQCDRQGLVHAAHGDR